jgi:small conductance mechanosensitive channel
MLFADPIVLPTTLPSAADFPTMVKAALPALTVMMVQGARDFLFAILILAAGWMLSRWVGRWTGNLIENSRYIDDTLKPLMTGFVSYFIMALTIVAVLGQFGVQTTSLIAILGAAGLAIGLALQGTLSNVASGVMLLILRPFRVRERIKVADATGPVREIGLFRTTILTDDGIYVSIPNATIFTGPIHNMSREGRRRINFTVEIDRNENLDTVMKAIREALADEPRVLKHPACTVEVDALGALSTTLVVQVWIENRGFGETQSEIKKRVREGLQKADISAPVPVAAPAVAPWAPAEDKPEHDGERPDRKPN